MRNASLINRMKGEEWYTCDRCGLDYPRGSVVVQNGLIVCRGKDTVMCYDMPGVDPARRALRLPLERDIKPLPQIDEEL